MSTHLNGGRSWLEAHLNLGRGLADWSSSGHGWHGSSSRLVYLVELVNNGWFGLSHNVGSNGEKGLGEHILKVLNKFDYI